MGVYIDWPYLFTLVAATIILGSVVGIVRGIRHGVHSGARFAAAIFLTGALATTIWVSLTQGVRYFATPPNFIPIRGVIDQLHNVNQEVGMYNLIGNVVMYIPIGFLTLMVVRGRWWHGLVAGAALSASMEILQLVLNVGAMDVDDLILNTVGAAVGAGLGVLANHLAFSRSPSTSQRRTQPSAARSDFDASQDHDARVVSQTICSGGPCAASAPEVSDSGTSKGMK